MTESPAWTTRLLAVGALLLTSGAFVFIVFANRPEGATASDASPQRVAALREPAQAIATGLSELGKGGSTKALREDIRAAMRQARAGREWVEATGGLVGAELLGNAFLRYEEYLDALGSTLANPRSQLRFRLTDRARRARAAFRSLPDSAGLETTVRGWERALALAERRRAAR